MNAHICITVRRLLKSERLRQLLLMRCDFQLPQAQESVSPCCLTDATFHSQRRVANNVTRIIFVRVGVQLQSPEISRIILTKLNYTRNGLPANKRIFISLHYVYEYKIIFQAPQKSLSVPKCILELDNDIHCDE